MWSCKVLNAYSIALPSDLFFQASLKYVYDDFLGIVILSSRYTLKSFAGFKKMLLLGSNSVRISGVGPRVRWVLNVRIDNCYFRSHIASKMSFLFSLKKQNQKHTKIAAGHRFSSKEPWKGLEAWMLEGSQEKSVKVKEVEDIIQPTIHSATGYHIYIPHFS